KGRFFISRSGWFLDSQSESLVLSALVSTINFCELKIGPHACLGAWPWRIAGFNPRPLATISIQCARVTGKAHLPEFTQADRKRKKQVLQGWQAVASLCLPFWGDRK